MVGIIFASIAIIVVIVSIVKLAKSFGAQRLHASKNSDILEELELRTAQREADRKRIAKEYERRKKEELLQLRKVFPIVSDNLSVQKEWALNDCNHDSKEQVDRQNRALENQYSKPLPIQISTISPSGFFLSSGYEGKLYMTFLTSCDCPDYEMRHLPCKHMYRLFYELEHPGARIKEVVDIDPEVEFRFLKLNSDERVAFVKLVRMSRHKSIMTIKSDALVKALNEKGFLIKSGQPNYVPMLEEMTKDQIILSLAKRSVEGYRPSWSKVKLIDWVLQSQSDFLQKQFKNFISVGIHPSVQEWADGINKVVSERYKR